MLSLKTILKFFICTTNSIAFLKEIYVFLVAVFTISIVHLTLPMSTCQWCVAYKYIKAYFDSSLVGVATAVAAGIHKCYKNRMTSFNCYIYSNHR